jgi:uncharacterized membrane protein YraQ (UPF0718 family)
MNFKTLINPADTGGFELKPDKVILALIASMVVLTLLSPHQGLESLKFMMDSITYIAPFFVLAVGLAASIKASGADKIIVRVFAGHPVKAIMLAAVFGALSPFCSCGVIPLIASMLAAGVPLAPVMAFWIASPIMDPEMFILTSAGISVEFALAKAGFAIALGLFAGFSVLLAQRWEWMRTALSAQILTTLRTEFVETALFLGKWLALAFFIESLMVAYISPDWIQRYTGGDSLFVVPVAALIGMPSYLNGYAAIPLIGELMEMGMSNGAAMAFMIAGAVSSIPAAIAVFALVKKPVFIFYLFTGLVGAIVSGLVFQTLTT